MTVVYNGSVGNDIVMNTGQDLTNATKLEIWCQNPDGTVDKWTATKHATAGYITYTTVAGDLAVSGNYILHAYVEWGATSKHPGRPKTLLVLDTSHISLIDNVRHLIQDLDEDAPMLSDEGIYYELTRAGNNKILAAAFCAENIAGQYASLVDKSMGNSSVSLSQKAEAWRKKSQALRQQALNPSLTPRASSSAPRALKFGIGQHDNTNYMGGYSITGYL